MRNLLKIFIMFMKKKCFLCFLFLSPLVQGQTETSGDFHLELVSIEHIEDKVIYKFLPDISEESYTIYARENRIIDYEMSGDTIVIKDAEQGMLNWIVVEDSDGRRSFKKIKKKD
jgi:hypothetical protein